jgi:hypothetical protein
LIGCAADIARPAALEYRAFVGTARRFVEAGWELVEYPSQTYIYIGVPRFHEARIWDGVREVIL